MASLGPALFWGVDGTDDEPNASIVFEHVGRALLEATRALGIDDISFCLTGCISGRGDTPMSTDENSTRIRANYMRFLLSSVEKLPPEKMRAAMERIPKDTLRLIEEHKGISFVPYDCLLRLNEAILAVLGFKGAVELSSSAIQNAAKSGLFFRGIATALTHMLSDHRRIAIMGTNGGLSMVTKGAGHFEEYGEDGEWYGIVWRDMPSSCANHDGQRASWEGAVGGTFRALGDEVETRSEWRASENSMVFWVRHIDVGASSPSPTDA
jgi:hypothetical protein